MPKETVMAESPDLPDVRVGWQRDRGVQVGVEPKDSVHQGMWSHLDRNGCNALIQVLRRARDSAFGRDE